jgi:arylsulfatase A-like enzyme
MADDQGYGDVGYNGHPHLKTPVLDEMAANNLRFDRFYAAAPVCSPTRGSVLTGRHPNRFGCFSWGHDLRSAEVTLAEVLKDAGYLTGHFGKWHLGSLAVRSGVSPGIHGFYEWFSSPNFFENNPLMCHNGKVIKTEGEGSIVIVKAALEFIREAVEKERPFLTVIWFGSPHGPHQALDEDKQLYTAHSPELQNYWGEITAMDRAIGHLRKGLRTLGVAENTLVWYTSDNGAIGPGSTGGLRGRKGTLYEGGLRVPTIIEWPAMIKSPRRTDLACCSVDIYPTILDIVGRQAAIQPPLDGVSLRPLLSGSVENRARERPLGFWVYPERGVGVNSRAILEEMARAEAAAADEETRNLPTRALSGAGVRPPYPDDLRGHSVWLDNSWKLHRIPGGGQTLKFELYDLAADPREEKNLADSETARVESMKTQLEAWQKSVVRSLNGEDYRTAGAKP